MPIIMILHALASLATPPWVIHQECWLTKDKDSCSVPNGKLDIVIGKPGRELQEMGVVVALIGKTTEPFVPVASLSAKVTEKLHTLKTGKHIIM